MDADDVLRGEDIARIKAVLAWHKNRYIIFGVKNINPCTHPMVQVESFSQARIFPNHKGIQFEGAIHEQFTASAIKAGLIAFYVTDILIEHHGYQDIDAVNAKICRNHLIEDMVKNGN